jgi:hypothetical protein
VRDGRAHADGEERGLRQLRRVGHLERELVHRPHVSSDGPRLLDELRDGALAHR